MKKQIEQTKDDWFAAQNKIKGMRHYRKAVFAFNIAMIALPALLAAYQTLRPRWFWLPLFFALFASLLLKAVIDYRRVQRIIAARKPDGEQGSCDMD